MTGICEKSDCDIDDGDDDDDRHTHIASTCTCLDIHEVITIILCSKHLATHTHTYAL